VLVAADRDELLQWFKLNKQNRTVREAEGLLAACGWEVDRQSSKEGLVWVKGSEVFTFPNSHGKPLKVGYIRALIQAINRADPKLEDGGDDDAGPTD
jgi:hypothetical protein